MFFGSFVYCCKSDCCGLGKPNYNFMMVVDFVYKRGNFA